MLLLQPDRSVEACIYMCIYIYNVHISIALIESLLGNLLLPALIICNKVEAKQVNKLQTDERRKKDFYESVTSLQCITQAIVGDLYKSGSMNR